VLKDPPSVEPVRQKLIELVELMPQPNQPDVAIYRCMQKQSITNLSLNAPNLLLPLKGTKMLQAGQARISGTSGDIVVMPGGMEFDVMNIPNDGSQQYLGLAVKFDEETIELFRRSYESRFSSWDVSPQWKCKADTLIYDVVLEWLQIKMNHTLSELQQRHRLSEILLVLAEHRMIGNVLLSQKTSTAQQVKKILRHDVSKDWKISDVSLELSVSESTLRRKLKLEDQSFRELLEEVRLLRGVGLVLESDLPIGAIAFECGYLSQSRFAERFRQRFAMSPTELRSTKNTAADPVIELNTIRQLLPALRRAAMTS